MSYKIIKYEDFDFSALAKIPLQPRKKGNQSCRDKYWYKDIVTAFDIETSYIPIINQSIMYVWQWAFGTKLCVVGRTWEEFTNFAYKLVKSLSYDSRLVVYVHNLSYEYHFLRGVHEFLTKDIIAIKPRKLLRALYDKKLEFRCSYLQTNMSLREFLEKMECDVTKSEMNYRKIRYPHDRIDDMIDYACRDVIGLVEAIEKEMKLDGDDLYTVPLTSTGYVRRDVKRAMHSVSKKWIYDQLPDWDTYVEEREAFRGGNTVANRYFIGHDVDNVKCADRSSSYPEVLINYKYPISKFRLSKEQSPERLIELIQSNYAVLFRITLTNIKLKNKYWGAPYISKSKCRNISGLQVCNGRVLSAESLDTTLTDVDFKIINDEYEFEIAGVSDIRYAKYGPLPKPLKDVIIKYYKDKTELKGVKGQEVYYVKQKNKLNGIYGMAATCPVREKYVIVNNKIEIDKNQNKENALNKYNNTAFLNYAWGVWTTAYSRLELEIAIKMIHDTPGAYFIYSDTDSVYYTGDVDFTAYNNVKIKLAIINNSVANDKKGSPHYLGVYEYDDDLPEQNIFKTLGAKKYVKYYNGKSHITIAGVNKYSGSDELDENGGLEAFKSGFVFKKSAGMEVTYNDDTWMYYPCIPDSNYLLTDKQNADIINTNIYHEMQPIMRITPNVALSDSTYKIGIEGDTLRALANINTNIERLIFYKVKETENEKVC